MFNERFKDPVEEEYPWITLEQIKSSSDKEELEKLFADGLSPDIFFEVSQENMEHFKLDYDLDELIDRKSTRLNSSHVAISYAVFCLKKKKKSLMSNMYR